jgi:N-acetyl-gamma-glutamylphosphate reductase
MDLQQIEEKKIDLVNQKLTAKEKKAAYMREYHLRRKNSKRNTADSKVVEVINKEVGEIVRDRFVKGTSVNRVDEGPKQISNVVDLSTIFRLKDKATIKLWKLSQDIDNLIVGAVSDGLNPVEVAGIIANRLKAVSEAAGSDVLDKLKSSILK